MATSRSKQASSSRRATSRSAGTTSRRSNAEVEVVEGAEGMNWETGVALVTAFLLVVALVLVDYQMGRDLGAGLLFK